MPDLSNEVRIDLIPDLDIQVGRLSDVVGSALPIAEKIAEVARASAPVDSGEYAGGIHAEATKAGARVSADDFKSAWIEFGIPSHGVPAQFNLRRAAEALGLKFRKR